MSDAFSIILWIGIAILVILPPKYDPAIRWKERRERQRQEGESE